MRTFSGSFACWAGALFLLAAGPAVGQETGPVATFATLTQAQVTTAVEAYFENEANSKEFKAALPKDTTVLPKPVRIKVEPGKSITWEIEAGDENNAELRKVLAGVLVQVLVQNRTDGRAMLSEDDGKKLTDLKVFAIKRNAPPPPPALKVVVGGPGQSYAVTAGQPLDLPVTVTGGVPPTGKPEVVAAADNKDVKVDVGPTGRVTVTPSAGVRGKVKVTVRAKQGDQTGSATAELTVDALPPPPPPPPALKVVVGGPGQSYAVTAGQPLDLPVIVTGATGQPEILADVDNADVAVKVGTGPTGPVTVTPAAGVRGKVTFTVRVKLDDQVGRATAVLTVNAPPGPGETRYAFVEEAVPCSLPEPAGVTYAGPVIGASGRRGCCLSIRPRCTTWSQPAVCGTAAIPHTMMVGRWVAVPSAAAMGVPSAPSAAAVAVSTPERPVVDRLTLLSGKTAADWGDLYDRGVEECRAGRTAVAHEYLAAAAHLANDARAWHYLGLTHYALGRVNDATAAIRFAAALDHRQAGQKRTSLEALTYVQGPARRFLEDVASQLSTAEQADRILADRPKTLPATAVAKAK